jgi:hypothetical protein
MESTIAQDDFGRLIIGGHIIYSFDIVPNTFEDMKAMINEKTTKVCLFNIKSPTIRPDETLECSFKNIHKDDSFLLVFGGWIPCAFIKSNTIIIADRNIVSEIVSRYENGKKKNNTPNDAFDGIFLCNRHSIDITAFVLEGNERKTPDNSKIDEQIESVTRSLRSALPSFAITEYPNGNNHYYAFKDKLASTIKKRMEFLQEIAPKLNRQFNERSRKLAIIQVFESAKRVQIEKKDFAILLALLRITMIGKRTAAQLVLKDSQVYSEEHAYNTACDLTAIELLANLHNFHTQNKSSYNVALITKDKGLSLFTALLAHPSVTDSNGDRLSITARISSAIFEDDPVIKKMYEDWSEGKF